MIPLHCPARPGLMAPASGRRRTLAGASLNQTFLAKCLSASVSLEVKWGEEGGPGRQELTPRAGPGPPEELGTKAPCGPSG